MMRSLTFLEKHTHTHTHTHTHKQCIITQRHLASSHKPVQVSRRAKGQGPQEPRDAGKKKNQEQKTPPFSMSSGAILGRPQHAALSEEKQHQKNTKKQRKHKKTQPPPQKKRSGAAPGSVHVTVSADGLGAVPGPASGFGLRDVQKGSGTKRVQSPGGTARISRGPETLLSSVSERNHVPSPRSLRRILEENSRKTRLMILQMVPSKKKKI